MDTITLACCYILAFSFLRIIIKFNDLFHLLKGQKFSPQKLFSIGLNNYNRFIALDEELFKRHSQMSPKSVVVAFRIFTVLLFSTLSFLYYVLVIDLFGHHLLILSMTVLSASIAIYYISLDLINYYKLGKGEPVPILEETTLNKLVFSMKYFGVLVADIIIVCVVIYTFVKGGVI